MAILNIEVISSSKNINCNKLNINRIYRHIDQKTNQSDFKTTATKIVVSRKTRTITIQPSIIIGTISNNGSNGNSGGNNNIYYWS